MSKLPSFAVALLFLTVSLVGVSSSLEPVAASFPGTNGQLVYRNYYSSHGYELHVIQPDGTAETRITTTSVAEFGVGFADEFEPAWSADGSKIAFRRGPDIYTMNADGSGVTQLTSGQGYNDNPNWSPDGTKIIFASQRHADPEATGCSLFFCPLEIYVMDADGANPLRLTTTAPTTFPNPANREPVWSPDGTQIAFKSNREALPPHIDQYDIYVMDPDGSGQTNITNAVLSGDSNQPDWSPDSTKIVFHRIEYVYGPTTRTEVTDDIWTMDRDGANAVRITGGLTGDTDGDLWPTWSPDGTKIAFTKLSQSSTDLYTMDPDGSSQTLLIGSQTHHQADWGTQQTSPLDGDSDGVADAADNCPNISNTDQSDIDQDGVGDACEDGETDGDGCPDASEQQTAEGSEISGGRRDYLNPNDYFNPTHDGLIRVDDILEVRYQYFKDDNDSTPGQPPYMPGYNPDTDRVFVGPLDWNLGPPNGFQRIDDVLNVRNQYFHDCP